MTILKSFNEMMKNKLLFVEPVCWTTTRLSEIRSSCLMNMLQMLPYFFLIWNITCFFFNLSFGPTLFYPTECPDLCWHSRPGHSIEKKKVLSAKQFLGGFHVVKIWQFFKHFGSSRIILLFLKSATTATLIRNYDWGNLNRCK